MVIFITIFLPSRELMSCYTASMIYAILGVNLKFFPNKKPKVKHRRKGTSSCIIHSLSTLQHPNAQMLPASSPVVLRLFSLLLKRNAETALLGERLARLARLLRFSYLWAQGPGYDSPLRESPSGS